MSEIRLNEASTYLGIERSLLDSLIKNGRELTSTKRGGRYYIQQEEIEAWKQRRESRTINLTRHDIIKAFKFAIDINYAGHTRADFGTSRKRSTTQAIENWTQGALAEVAFQKFIKSKFDVELELEFRVFEGKIVGQDIVGVVRGRITNPPRKRISVKSGKHNGMVLIVSVKEAESPDRVSEYYVFVRIIYPDDFIMRLLREHQDLSDRRDIIPEFIDFKAEIVGYCLKEELEKRNVPEAGIEEVRYVKASGLLKNSDRDWQTFVESL